MIDTQLTLYDMGILVAGALAIIIPTVLAVHREGLTDKTGVSDEEDPEIYYVPNMYNHYNFVEDIVVLDENLKEYPQAHQLIKNHELKHAQNHSFWYTLKLEFKTDVQKHFGDGDAIKEVDEYMENRSKASLRTHIKLSTVEWSRNLWMMVLSPIARVYKFFKGGDQR